MAAAASAPVKAYLETERGAQIPCLFNPAKLQVAKSNSWTGGDAEGRNAPDLVFTGGGSGTMTLDLIFDTTNDGSAVTVHTNKVADLMSVDKELADYDSATDTGRPQWVKFHWGDMHTFKAVLTTMDMTFTYFSGAGVPLRANVTVSLTQYEPEASWGPQNPTSGTPSPQRLHQVHKGETLDRIAARHYKDSTKWRLIAEANGITDPLALKPGSMLAIPRLRD
jgi:hypothetical protein